MPIRDDLSGKVFTRWTVERFSRKDRHGGLFWFCMCSCGTRKEVIAASLRSGLSKSCGCISVERSTKHDGDGTPEYRSWCAMRIRCTSESHAQYKDYGGRGIKICERWLDFKNFLADMGKRPEGYSLDRIDNNGNYEPSNCKWSTRSEQARNRRRIVHG